MAIALRMGMLTSPRMRPSFGTSESILTLTDFTPSTDISLPCILLDLPRNGQAGVVSMM
jgi:hypothetical protein